MSTANQITSRFRSRAKFSPAEFLAEYRQHVETMNRVHFEAATPELPAAFWSAYDLRLTRAADHEAEGNMILYRQSLRDLENWAGKIFRDMRRPTPSTGAAAPSTMSTAAPAT